MNTIKEFHMNTHETAGFRRQLSGYNREDVNAYIRELDLRTAAEKASLEEELNSIKAQLAEAQEAAAALRSEKEELTSALADKAKEIAGLGEKLDEAVRRCDSLTSDAEKAAAADAAHLAEIGALRQQLLSFGITPVELNDDGTPATDRSVSADDAADNHDSPLYKLKMYDKISGQLGDILINANRNAREIVNAATQEVDRMKSDANEFCETKRRQCDEEVQKIRRDLNEEAAVIRNDLSATASALLSNVNANIHGNMESCTHEISSCLSELQYEVKSMLSKITARTDDMNERISYFTTAVSDEIEKDLASIDKKFGLNRQPADDNRPDNGADRT